VAAQGGKRIKGKEEKGKSKRKGVFLCPEN